ncbi:hypothetical protein DINM_000023, partial [Dirofilaria immitis]|nr:hypothetical protein [Dirofilaria immitis]
MEKLREQKHRIVDESLTDEQRQKLSKASKHRLAREIGVNCRTITEVLDWLAENHGNTKPTKPEIVSKTMKRLKTTKSMKPEKSRLVDPGASNIDSPARSSTKLLNGSLVNGTTHTNDNREKIQRCDSTTNDRESSSSFAATSTVTPADALEGRKLALKKLQEKLEQFKAKRRGKMTAYQYEEKRKLKRRMSKLKMKERRTVAKQEVKNSKLPSDEAVPNKRLKLENKSMSGEMEKNDDKLIFSKFDFI